MQTSGPQIFDRSVDKVSCNRLVTTKYQRIPFLNTNCFLSIATVYILTNEFLYLSV